MDADNTIDYARPFVDARWCNIVSRRVACPGLAPNVLLHAGPPYEGAPPTPVRNAAVQALLFEGMAKNEAEAGAMLANARVQLRPAQDHGVVTPLAMVVSASMLMIEVRQFETSCFAPIVEGPSPALRFGVLDPACRERLAASRAWIMDRLAPMLRRTPLAVAEIVRTALAQGDECHARTGLANEAMVDCLTGIDADIAAKLRANPAFVLPVLMAAAGAALRNQLTGIEAIGGNGIGFGMRRRGSARWNTVAATAPRGIRFTDMSQAEALPAIGDSAVLDICGLGGQALAAAPQLAQELGSWLPHDYMTRRQAIIDPATGILDCVRTDVGSIGPLINLAVLGAGAGGLIGRGVYLVPTEIFRV